MLHHSLHKSKLYIDNVEVKTFISAVFTESGNNQLQSLSASFSDPDLEDMSLFNKKVEFFLNNGSQDGVPLFRGYINNFKASDSKIQIKALDPRGLMVGERVIPIVIDEKDNYDGYTIVQFLHDYIENEINYNDTLISTDFLTEMDRPVFMTGIRGETSPYEKIVELIKSKIDDETSIDRTDLNLIHDYFIDIVHGSDASGPTVRKKRSLDSNHDMYFKYGDGIRSMSYRENAPPSFALGTVEDTKEQVILDYGNAPQGARGLRGVKVEGKSRGELKEKLLSHIILEQRNTKEISINCTKGYNLGLGNIIFIDVPKLNLSGNYAITGKTVNVSKGNMTCKLQCNNKPIKLSDYIN